MGNDLHARVRTLARLRRGRIGVSDRWHRSGGTARDNYLTGAPYSRQFRLTLRTCRQRPRGCHHAPEQRDEVAWFQLIELHSVPHQPGPDAGYQIGGDRSAGVRTSAQRTVAGWVSDAQVPRNHAIIRKYSLFPASPR